MPDPLSLSYMLGSAGLKVANRLFDLESLALNAIGANQYFEKWQPNMQEKMAETIRDEFSIHVGELKNDLKKASGAAKKAYTEWDTNRTAALEAAIDPQIAQNENIQNLFQFTPPADDVRDSFNLRVDVYDQLVNRTGEISKNNDSFGVRHMIPQAYRVQQKVLSDLEGRFNHERQELKNKLDNLTVQSAGVEDQAALDALKDGIQEAHNKNHKEQVQTVKEAFKNALHEAHIVAKQEKLQNTIISTQRQLFAALAESHHLKQPNVVGDAAIDNEAGENKMYKVDFKNLREDVVKMNKERGWDQDPVGLQAGNGTKIEITANGFKAPLPWLAKFWFYWSPWQNMKDIANTMIAANIAAGDLENNGAIDLKSTHKDQKSAEEGAMAFYEAAVEMGLSTNQFNCYVNGVKKSPEQMLAIFREHGREAKMQAAEKTGQDRAAEFKSIQEDIDKLHTSSTPEDKVKSKEDRTRYDKFNRQKQECKAQQIAAQQRQQPPEAPGPIPV